MKEYKPSYSIGMVTYALSFLCYTVLGAPVFLTVALVTSVDFKMEMIYLGVAFLAVSVVVAVICLIAILVSAIIRLFVSPTVTLTDRLLTVDGRVIHLDSILEIHYSIAVMHRHSSDPAYMSLVLADGGYCMIEKPSVALVLRLRRLCRGAGFEIINLKERLLFALLGGLLVGVALSIVVIKGNADPQ